MHRHVFPLSLLLTATLTAADPARLTSAIQLFRNEKLVEAKAAFEKLVEAEPDNAEANFWLGRTAVDLNAPEQAVQYFEKAVALDATCARYFHFLGDAYGLSVPKAGLFSKLDLAHKCLAAYDKAVALAPDDVAARRSRYEYYMQAPELAGGGHEKAATEAAEIEKRDPVLGASLRADLRAKENKVDEAFSISTDLLHHQPDNKIAQFYFGRLVAMHGRELDKGELALKSYLSYTPTEDEPPLWSAHWRLAQILEAKGDVAAARLAYEETLKLNPAWERARAALKRLSP
jgi:predicted Zn-dependent protease